MSNRLDPCRESWMRAPETRAVMSALLSGGGAARFVGGAVRNALLGLDVRDIDIATPLLPGEVIRRLEASQIRAIPTGVDHGTVTAVADGRAFEITTLRRDVETDGRHAVVAFSDDWSEDAARRDFTINALYASPEGEIFDYTGGIADLQARCIRFIGDPVTRIREDYLRILRLFRFHAWYGKGALDGQSRGAARKERNGLDKLSGERLQKEMLRLLEAKNPLPSLRIMADDQILVHVIPAEPEKFRLDRIEHLVAIDEANHFPADPILRLAALMPPDQNLATKVAGRLKLSNGDRDRLADLAGAGNEIVPAMAPEALRKLLYRLGRQPVHDKILLRWSADGDASHAAAWRALLAHADAWIRPSFPLSGRDILTRGVVEGPMVGRILSTVEGWWIENDFTDDKHLLTERLKVVIRETPA